MLFSCLTCQRLVWLRQLRRMPASLPQVFTDTKGGGPGLSSSIRQQQAAACLLKSLASALMMVRCEDSKHVSTTLGCTHDTTNCKWPHTAAPTCQTFLPPILMQHTDTYPKTAAATHPCQPPAAQPGADFTVNSTAEHALVW